MDYNNAQEIEEQNEEDVVDSSIGTNALTTIMRLQLKGGL